MVLAWGIIAPGLIATCRAVGMPTSEEFPLVSYQAMSFEEAEAYAKSPSPRYWLLWPGVLMMLVYSVRHDESISMAIFRLTLR